MYTIAFIIIILIYLVTLKSRTYNRFKSRFEEVKGTRNLPVDMVYCISMPDRLDYIQSKMKELGTSYKLFHAISPNVLSYWDYFTLSSTLIPWSPIYKKFTKLPVALSFFMCYYDAYVNGYNTICILEDDIKFVVNIEEIRSLIQEFKETDQDILFMGYCKLKCNGTNFKQISPNLFSVPGEKNILCNHAMVLKRSLFTPYVHRSPFLYYTQHNDRTLSSYLKKHSIKKCVPSGGYINQNVSELGSNNENLNNNIYTCTL